MLRDAATLGACLSRPLTNGETRLEISCDSGAAITSYAWTFGDGVAGSGAPIMHPFLDHRKHNADVIDNSGRRGEWEKHHAYKVDASAGQAAGRETWRAIEVGLAVAGQVWSVTFARRGDGAACYARPSPTKTCMWPSTHPPEAPVVETRRRRGSGVSAAARQ